MYEARRGARGALAGDDMYEGIDEDELSDEEAAEELRRQRVGRMGGGGDFAVGSLIVG